MEVFGTDAVVYYGMAGATSGSLTELQGVRNCSLNMSGSEADVTVRGSRWKRTTTGMNDISLELEILFEKENAGLATLRNAFINASGVELAILTGDIASSGSEGPKGTFKITGFNRGEGTADPITVNVSSKLYQYDTYIAVEIDL